MAQAVSDSHRSLMMLPQHVPSRVCVTCEVCCRFPEAESFLRPYFTAEEVRAAIAAGLPADVFPHPEGGQIRLVPHPGGDGYLCPAFDLATSQCRIYDDRPFDCQLYPLAVMWSADHQSIVLGGDAKCPFLAAGGDAAVSTGAFDSYAREMATRLQTPELLELFERNPRLVTRYQDDVVVVQTLPLLTTRVVRALEREAAVPLTLADRPRFEQAARQSAPRDPEISSAWLFANHYLWQDVLPYTIRTIEGRLCLFAESPDGLFMPLPPLGAPPTKDLLARLFEDLSSQAKGVGVARIENVPADMAKEWQTWGYRVAPKDAEYLYRTDDLVTLRGDRYKSQRAACNQLLREARVRVEPYDRAQRDQCWSLFETWRGQKAPGHAGTWPAYLLEDAGFFHRRLLEEALALGLTGWVLWVDDRVRGYTFGGALGDDVFCVMAEIADRSVTGAAETIFRECARGAAAAGFGWMNTMDASGLAGLARSKQAYHPASLVHPCVVTQGGAE